MVARGDELASKQSNGALRSSPHSINSVSYVSELIHSFLWYERTVFVRLVAGFKENYFESFVILA